MGLTIEANCPAKCNISSAREHPKVVDRSTGRNLGPFAQGEIPGLHINRIGVIPKGRASGKWRLFTNLSFPDNRSVSDGISPVDCTLAYTSVERVARAAHVLGLGTLLAKAAVKGAYRLVSVHPDDRYLLGMEWVGAHYVNTMLPFALRLAQQTRLLN